ncbi:MAG: SCO family protein [Alcaligenaceae bacterium]|nr:SCO family protein [Alcaligenaceae bacterium]
MRILRTLLASVVLLAVGGVALGVLTDGYAAFTSESARRLRVRTQLPQMPAVALETQAGERIDLTDLRGRWLVVDFIYTRCQSYCLALGAEFVQLQEQLAASLASGQVLLLSVSFDPQHDTPQQLTRYLHRFGDRHQGWMAARPASVDDLQRIKQAFGIIVISDGLGGYEHNAGLQIVDPQGRLVRILDPGEGGRIPGLLFPDARK